MLSENWVLETRFATTVATRMMAKPMYRYEIIKLTIAFFFVVSGFGECRAWLSATCPRKMARIAVSTPVKQRMVRGSDAMARTSEAVDKPDPRDIDGSRDGFDSGIRLFFLWTENNSIQ